MYRGWKNVLRFLGPPHFLLSWCITVVISDKLEMFCRPCRMGYLSLLLIGNQSKFSVRYTAMCLKFWSRLVIDYTPIVVNERTGIRPW